MLTCGFSVPGQGSWRVAHFGADNSTLCMQDLFHRPALAIKVGVLDQITDTLFYRGRRWHSLAKGYLVHLDGISQLKLVKGQERFCQRSVIGR